MTEKQSFDSWSSDLADLLFEKIKSQLDKHGPVVFKDEVVAFKHLLIRKALLSHEGRVMQSKSLGINRTGLIEKLKIFNKEGVKGNVRYMRCSKCGRVIICLEKEKCPKCRQSTLILIKS